MSETQVTTGDQQLVIGQKYPKPTYSRLIEVAGTDFDTATPQFHFSPPLGNRIWLLKVYLWLQRTAGAAAPVWSIQVKAADCDIRSVVDARKAESVISCSAMGAFPCVYGFQAEKFMEFEIGQLWLGQHRRFGVIGECNDVNTYNLQGFFLISEG
jgi:hypothetical protein